MYVLIISVGAHIHISRTDDFTFIYQLLQTMRAPSGNTGNGKDRCKQLCRNSQHGIYQTAVEVHVGADRLQQVSSLRNQARCKTLYRVIQHKFILLLFFLRQMLCISFQDHLTGIRIGIYGMSHTVYQSGSVKGFFVQNADQIIADCLLICIVRTMLLQILKHLHNLQVGTAVFRSLQRRHGCRHCRIGIRSGGSHHMIGKGTVITAAMLCMKHQRHIQNLCFQFRIHAVLAEHVQNAFRGGQPFLRRANHQRLIQVKMAVCIIRIHCHHGHLRNQLQRLTQYIGNRDVIRVLIIGIKKHNTLLQGVHQIGRRRFHDDITDKLSGKLPQISENPDKAFQFILMRKPAKQKKIRRFFKHKPFGFVSVNQVDYIDSLKIQLSINGFAHSVDHFHCLYIRDLRQAGKNTLTIGITESPFYIIFPVQTLINFAGNHTVIHQLVKFLI